MTDCCWLALPPPFESGCPSVIRSFAFTTQGRLHTENIPMFLMPTLLADTNLFLWVDLEKPSAEEAKMMLEDIFHFHPLSIEDCVMVSPSPKVEEYNPKEDDMFAPYLFMVIHAVDYSRRDGVFATSELNFFLGKNFLVTYHDVPLKSVQHAADRCLKSCNLCKSRSRCELGTDTSTLIEFA